MTDPTTQPAAPPVVGHSLAGRVSLVTGASRGIGAAIARTFAAAGATVVLAARDGTAIEAMREDLRGSGTEVLAVPTDVTDPAQVAQMVKTVIDRFGRLDVACNNAGGSPLPPTPLAETPIDSYDHVLALNLRAVFVCLQHEIRAMLPSGSGTIVNISSTAGSHAVAGLAGYVSAKHGLEGLTKVAALDYAAAGIRINAVAPGPILTTGLLRAGAQAQEATAQAVPMRRIGQPEDVAAAALWLCSDAASYLTGTTLIVDGGRLAGTPPAHAARRQ